MKSPHIKHRFERFGGIVALDHPPLLAFVDRPFMRGLGLGESELWCSDGENDEDDGEDHAHDNASIGVLSAPTEVHLAATNACGSACRHCYMDSGERSPDEMDTPRFRRALEALARMGVFHIALGGGEALLREDLLALAAYTRTLGMVPNLTISGRLMTPQLAARMHVFGQVNVSIDGVDARHGTFREAGRFALADRAISLLTAAGVATGINCVLGRRNFPHLPELFAYAKAKGANEVEILRFKPVGRARGAQAYEATTFAQNIRLAPLLVALSECHGVCAKIDCSFVPMLCYQRPPREVLEASATYGCEAANVLLGVRSDGAVGGCSFLPSAGFSVHDLPERWQDDAALKRLRTWPARAPDPCASCEYLGLCKGGCRAVAAAVTGDPDAPDPDCPFVVEHHAAAQRARPQERG